MRWPEDPPSRPERHIPNSIASMRARLIRALSKPYRDSMLWCHSTNAHKATIHDAVKLIRLTALATIGAL